MEEDFDQELPEWSEEYRQKMLREMPLFVSIPRSGCNWIQAVMELYFNRHRALKAPNTPSWLKTKFKNPMWMHTHDNFNFEDVENNKPAIFLYRNPTDVVYSLTKLQNNLNNATVMAFCQRWARCYKKWAVDKNNVLTLKYENLLVDPIGEMKRISRWYNVDFIPERAQWAFEVVGDKKKVNRKNGMNKAYKNPQSGTYQYEEEREIFREKLGSQIEAQVQQFLDELK